MYLFDLFSSVFLPTYFIHLLTQLMPKRKEISQTIKNQCIGLVKGGHCIRGIGRTLSLPPSTVSFIVRRWRSTGSTTNLGRSSRPKKVTARGARQIKNIVKLNKRNTLRGINELYNHAKDQNISSKTVSRTLHQMGFWARRPCKKPLVSKANKRKRLDFYHRHKNWGVNNGRMSSFRMNLNLIFLIRMGEQGFGDRKMNAIYLNAQI